MPREPIFTGELSRQVPVLVVTLAANVAVIYGLRLLTSRFPSALHIMGIALLCYFVVATVYYAVNWRR